MTTDELRRKMLGPIQVEPLEGGVQQGKRLFRFPDGTKAVFKPARGERGPIPLPHSPTTLAAIAGSLTFSEQRWFSNLVEAWGEAKVLRMWESLRAQIDW